MPMSMDTLDMMLRLDLTQRQRLGLIAAANGQPGGTFDHLRNITDKVRADFAKWQEQYSARSRAARRSSVANSPVSIGPSKAELARRRAEAAPIVEHMANVYDFCIGKSRASAPQPLHVPPMPAVVRKASADNRPQASLSTQVVDLIGRMRKVYRGDTSGGPDAA